MGSKPTGGAMAQPSSHDDKRPKIEPGLEDESDGIANSPGFGWQLCEGDPDTKRVALKENDVKRAIFYATQLHDLLVELLDDDEFPEAEALDHWISSIGDLVKQHHSFEVLVGVAGQTGAGKTSLLNALLDVYELLPSGQEQAATAVSCKASWNYDLEPGHEFRAEVHFQTQEQIIHDLAWILESFCKHKVAQKADYDNEDDRVNDLAEHASIIKDGMAKIRAVWSLTQETIEEMAWKCQDDAELYNAAKDISESSVAVVELLKSGKKAIYDSDGEALAKQIKPYLDSTSANHGEGSDFAAWPLIQTVDLYIRSDILKYGISLVDLPGIGDNVKSRSDVARNYYNRLALKLIVAPIIRAADDEFTQDLMSEGQELRLQMKGKYNNIGFGVVLSKMDDMDPESYLKRDKNDPVAQHHKTLVQAAKTELKELNQTRKRLEKRVKKAQSTVKSLEKKLKKLSATSSDVVAITKALRAENETIREVRDQLDGVSRNESTQKKKVSVSEGHLRHWAIMTRNAHVYGRMQTEFLTRQRRKAREEGSEIDDLKTAFGEMEVMPTSVRTFWTLQNKGKRPIDFPTEEYTGVPYVKQWIHKATAGPRERHLDIILNGFNTVMAGLDNWCRDIPSDRSIGLSREKVEETLKTTHEKFHDRLSKLFGGIHTQIVELDPLKNPARPKKRFHDSCRQIVNAWSLKHPHSTTETTRLHWITYRAITKHHGGPYWSKANKEHMYDWVPKLARPLLSIVSQDWSDVFNRQIPSLWNLVERKHDQIWVDYQRELVQAAAKVDSALSHYLSGTDAGLQAVKNELNAKGRSLLGDFPEAASQSYPLLEDRIRDHMIPGFTKASDFTGDGSYKKRRDMLESHAKRKAGTMFQDGWDIIKNDIEKKKADVNVCLEKMAAQGNKTTEMQVKSLLDNALGEHELGGDQTTIRGRMQKLLAEWRSEWQCPKGYEDHILLKDLRIPQELRTEDLQTIKKEGDESGSESEADTEEDEDESS